MMNYRRRVRAADPSPIDFVEARMSDLEKTLGKEVSRRSFLKTTGAGLGLAAGALVFGTGIVGAQTQAPAGSVAEQPFPYVELDPEDARDRKSVV